VLDPSLLVLFSATNLQSSTMWGSVHVTHLSPHILSPHHYIGHKLDNIMAQKCSNFITASVTNEAAQCLHMDNGVSVDMLRWMLW